MESKIAEVMRAIARPAISIIFAAVMAQLVIEGIEAPEWFLYVAIPTISWWFVERAVTHARASNSATVDKIAEKLADAIKKQ